MRKFTGTMTWKRAVVLGVCLALSLAGCRRQSGTPVTPVMTPEPAVRLPAELRAFFDAIADGDMDTVRTALNKHPEWTTARDEVGLTALHMAATMAHEDMVRLLLERGADVNARTPLGTTPLHDAVRWGNRAVAELLITRGADVNARNQSGDTVLHHAAVQSDESVVKLLIAKGADVNARNDGGQTPLDLAKEAYPHVAEVLARQVTKP